MARAIGRRRIERARNQDRLDLFIGRARVAVRQEAGGLQRPQRLVDRLPLHRGRGDHQQAAAVRQYARREGGEHPFGRIAGQPVEVDARHRT